MVSADWLWLLTALLCLLFHHKGPSHSNSSTVVHPFSHFLAMSLLSPRAFLGQFHERWPDRENVEKDHRRTENSSILGTTLKKRPIGKGYCSIRLPSCHAISPMAGHLGRCRTTKRLLQRFYCKTAFNLL